MSHELSSAISGTSTDLSWSASCDLSCESTGALSSLPSEESLAVTTGKTLLSRSICGNEASFNSSSALNFESEFNAASMRPICSEFDIMLLSSNEIAASDISDSLRSTIEGKFVFDESQSLMLASVSEQAMSFDGGAELLSKSPKSSLKSLN